MQFPSFFLVQITLSLVENTRNVLVCIFLVRFILFRNGWDPKFCTYAEQPPAQHLPQKQLQDCDQIKGTYCRVLKWVLSTYSGGLASARLLHRVAMELGQAAQLCVFIFGTLYLYLKGESHLVTCVCMCVLCAYLASISHPQNNTGYADTLCDMQKNRTGFNFSAYHVA